MDHCAIYPLQRYNPHHYWGWAGFANRYKGPV
jgi:hypothetical protein